MKILKLRPLYVFACVSLGNCVFFFCRSPGVAAVLDGKLANGVADGTTHVDTVFMVGGADGVKREPEDLTRRSISPSERLIVGRRRPVYLPPVEEGTSRLDQATKDELEAQIKEEGGDRPRTTPTFVLGVNQSVDDSDKMSSYVGFTPSPQPGYEHGTYLGSPQATYTTSASPAVVRGSVSSYSTGADQYYEYYRPTNGEPQYTIARPDYNTSVTEPSFERYARPGPPYKSVNLTVDSSPDSGTSSDPGREHPQVFTTQVSVLFC